MVRLSRFAVALFLAAAPAAAQTPKPVVIGQGFLAEGLDAGQGAVGWALQSHGVAEALFTVDREGRVAQNLAEGLSREGEAWRVRLKPGLKFSDGSALDAAAVKASLERSIATNPRAAAQTGRLTATVLSPTELSLAPEKPVAAMDSVLAEFPLVIQRVDGDRFVYSGPFVVEEFRRGELIRLAPNPHFRDAGDRPPVVIRRLTDAQTLALGLESGELDLAFNLAAETLLRLRRREGLSVKGTPVAYQYMLLMNAAKPPLDDARVRRALDLAVDRAQLVEVLGAGEAATGLYPRFMPFALTAPLPTDAAVAGRLLDEAGWIRPRAGAPREKAGVTLEIVLTNYPQRADFLTLTPVLRAQLEAVGFRVRAETVENITAHIQQKNFHAAFWTMHTAPGGDPAFALEQYLRSTAPLNVMGWKSAAMDALLDRLRETEGAEARDALGRQAQALILAEAPISFLMTPVWHVGLSRRVAGYEPFPSDYYIVRADLTAR